jgi:hypothetical protein
VTRFALPLGLMIVMAGCAASRAPAGDPVPANRSGRIAVDGSRFALVARPVQDSIQATVLRRAQRWPRRCEGRSAGSERLVLLVVNGQPARQSPLTPGVCCRSSLVLRSVEHVEIVKGPEALRRFGPDAADGAIIVRTKGRWVFPAGTNLCAPPERGTVTRSAEPGEVET